MDKSLDDTIIQYAKFVDQLSDESVEEFRNFASPNVHYQDPIVDVRGVDDALAYWHSWFEDLEELQFKTYERAQDGQTVFGHWKMTFRFKRRPKKLWELDGVSKVIFDGSGKIVEQIDYWDASPLLEYFPVLGKFVTLIKRLV